jgi:enoyl-CoA hydratase
VDDVAPEILVERPLDGVTRVTLNRPHHLNAVTERTAQLLFDTFDGIGRDVDCRVVVLTGAGRGFCAGDDTADYHAPEWIPVERLGFVQSNMYQQKVVATLVPRMRALPQPIIAAVNGPAAGFGYALALGADLRLAGRSAVFVNGYTNVGASGAEMGLSWLLQRIVGATRAAELVLTGRAVDAEEAERIGLVLRAVDDDALADAALELARAILAVNPFATWMGKTTLWANLEIPSLEAAIEMEAKTQILALVTDDAVERRDALRERRPPEYKLR